MMPSQSRQDAGLQRGKNVGLAAEGGGAGHERVRHEECRARPKRGHLGSFRAFREGIIAEGCEQCRRYEALEVRCDRGEWRSGVCLFRNVVPTGHEDIGANRETGLSKSFARTEGKQIVPAHDGVERKGLRAT